MTKDGKVCKRCKAARTMHVLYKYDMRVRLIRLFIPYQRIRCDSCGQEAWAWRGSLVGEKAGDFPPGLLLALCITAIVVALCIAR